jgi:glycosyltransferase involved in cell wall biosynthesis
MEHGIQVTALDSDPSMSRYRNRVVAMRRLIRSTKPDLVHATLHPAIVASAPAVLGTPARLVVTWANTPLEATEHAGLVPWRVWLRHTIEMVLTTAVRARFHAVTNGVAQACRRRYRVSARRVRVAERGRDAQRFAPLSAAELDSLRASLGLDPTQRVVLAVGRVAPQKNSVRFGSASLSRCGVAHCRCARFFVGRGRARSGVGSAPRSDPSARPA